LQAQKLVSFERERALLSLAFYRDCGHEYYTVWRAQYGEGVRLTPQHLSNVRGTGDASAGYL